MKLNKTIMMATLVAGGLLAGIPLQAQDAPKDKPAGDQPPAMSPTPRARPQISLDGLTKQLNLTDDQKPKVKAIMDEQQAKMAELRKDTGAAPEDRSAKMKEIRDGTTAKMKEILTPEQFAKYDKMGSRNRRAPGALTAPAAPATPAAPAAPAGDDKAKN